MTNRDSRILFSLLDAGVGGGQRVAMQIAERLQSEGDTIGLVVPALGPAVDGFVNIGARVHYCDLARIRKPHPARQLARVLGRYDLLYSHTAIGGQILGDAAARMARVPHLIHQHTFPYFSSQRTDARLQRELFRLLLGRRNFIAVAPHVRDELVRLGASPQRVRVVPNGVAIAAPGKGEHMGPVRVGMLGRFDPGKGMLPFVEAACLVEGNIFIIGASSGPFASHEADVRRVAAAAGVAIEEPGEAGIDFLRSLDIVVVPSRYEGCPLVLLEAMSIGRAVVATDIPGIRAVVGDGGAILVAVDDPRALAEAISRLARDQDERASLSQEGREIVEKRFTIDRTLDAAVAAVRVATA